MIKDEKESGEERGNLNYGENEKMKSKEERGEGRRERVC